MGEVPNNLKNGGNVKQRHTDMKTSFLNKENLVGKFLLVGHTSDGYIFGDLFDDKDSAEKRYNDLKSAFAACDNSTCVTGSIEVLEMPEDISLFVDKKDVEDEMLDDNDMVEIPRHFGYSENYIVLFPMNDCVIDYCDVEGNFIDSL